MSKETNKQLLSDKLDYGRLVGEICEIVLKVLFTVAFVSGLYSVLLRVFSSLSATPCCRSFSTDNRQFQH